MSGDDTCNGFKWEPISHMNAFFFLGGSAGSCRVGSVMFSFVRLKKSLGSQQQIRDGRVSTTKPFILCLKGYFPPFVASNTCWPWMHGSHLQYAFPRLFLIFYLPIQIHSPFTFTVLLCCFHWLFCVVLNTLAFPGLNGYEYYPDLVFKFNVLFYLYYTGIRLYCFFFWGGGGERC